MNANCKSCDSPLDQAATYCPACGGKVIDKRLSLRGTMTEFIVPFFSWDHRFFKTIWHLIIRPEMVLTAYISGARKKYSKPFPFLIIYGTIGLLFYKFFPMPEINDVVAGLTDGLQGNPSGTTAAIPDQDYIRDRTWRVIHDYYNFFVLSLVPVLAAVTYMTFKKYDHNFSEHLIFHSYLQSSFGFVSIISLASGEVCRK